MNEILEVSDLSVSFSINGISIPAVHGVSFSLYEGEAVAIVGESGSGKTAAVQSLLRLNSAKVSGKAIFEGKDLLQMSEKGLNEVRGAKIGMVFQDPLTSLNPTMKVGKQIMEALRIHKIKDRAAAKRKALELLELVDIPDPEVRFDQYPHQLSGGMRQRVLIAIALSCNPRLLMADEPTTALDTTTQMQILKLLKGLQQRFSMTLLLITHDLGVVSEICDRAIVFHRGKIVEEGPIEQILYSPRHPYTRMLLSCVPRIESCWREDAP